MTPFPCPKNLDLDILYKNKQVLKDTKQYTIMVGSEIRGDGIVCVDECGRRSFGCLLNILDPPRAGFGGYRGPQLVIDAVIPEDGFLVDGITFAVDKETTMKTSSSVFSWKSQTHTSLVIRNSQLFGLLIPTPIPGLSEENVLSIVLDNVFLASPGGRVPCIETGGDFDEPRTVIELYGSTTGSIVYFNGHMHTQNSRVEDHSSFKNVGLTLDRSVFNGISVSWDYWTPDQQNSS